MVLRDVVSDSYKHNLYFEIQPTYLNRLTNNKHYNNIKEFVESIETIQKMLDLKKPEDVYNIITEYAKMYKYDEKNGVVRDTQAEMPSIIQDVLGYVKNRSKTGDSSTVEILLENLVKATYGPLKRPTLIPLSEFDNRASNDTTIVDFVPMSNRLAKIKAEEDAIKEEQIEKLREKARTVDGAERANIEKKIEELEKTSAQEFLNKYPDWKNIKVKLIVREDPESERKVHVSTQLTRNRGPLQTTMNAMAASNASIRRELNYNAYRGDQKIPVTMKVAPPVLSSGRNTHELKVTKQYFDEVRELQKKVLKDLQSSYVRKDNEKSFEAVEMLDKIIHDRAAKLKKQIKNGDTSAFASVDNVEAIVDDYIKQKEGLKKKHSLEPLTFSAIKNLLDVGHVPIRRDNTLPKEKLDVGNVRAPQGARDLESALYSRYSSGHPAMIKAEFSPLSGTSSKSSSTPSNKSNKKENKTYPIPEGFPKNSKVRNAWQNNVTKHRELTVDQLIAELRKEKLTSHQKELLSIIEKYKDKNNIKVFVGELKKDKAGLMQGYTAGGTNPKIVLMGKTDNYVNIAIHELIHSVTINSINKVKKNKEGVEEYERKFYNTISKIMESAKAEMQKRNMNPDVELFEESASEKDVAEFIASMSNPKVWNNLKTIGILEEIFEAIKEFLYNLAGLNVPKDKKSSFYLMKSFEQYVVLHNKAGNVGVSNTSSSKKSTFESLEKVNSLDNISDEGISNAKTIKLGNKPSARKLIKDLAGIFNNTDENVVIYMDKVEDDSVARQIINDVLNNNAIKKNSSRAKFILNSDVYKDVKDLNEETPEQYAGKIEHLEELGLLKRNCK